MKKFNLLVVALLYFSIIQNSLITSSVHPTKVEYNHHSRGVYVIHEDGSQNCGVPENGSGKNSTSTGGLTLASLNNDNPRSVNEVIAGIRNGDIDDEEYVTDNKEDFPAFKDDMPIEVYHSRHFLILNTATGIIEILLECNFNNFR